MEIPRIKVPPEAAEGEVITIRALVAHPMETGFRKGLDGKVIPRQIIRSFQCWFEDRLIIEMEFRPGVAANPYVEFGYVVSRAGRFKFRWVEDGGEMREAEAGVKLVAASLQNPD